MSYYLALKAIYETHERWLMPAVLLSGVTADFVTFRTIRIGTAFALLGLYLLLAGLAIGLINTTDASGQTRGGTLRSCLWVLLTERKSLLGRLLPRQVIRVQDPGRVYVFSSVFAPADLETVIAHDWFYFDETSGEWIDRGRPTFPIRGGREGGYRGFSYTSDVDEGRWRVDIETGRGQVLGRLRFRIELVDEAPRLIELTR